MAMVLLTPISILRTRVLSNPRSFFFLIFLTNEEKQKKREKKLRNRKANDIKIERKHKEHVLKLLEKHKYTSEDIADIYGLPEKYIIDVLNELIDQGIVKLNKNLNYELVDHDY